ncbi:MAG: hypothetical protein ORO03_07660 [Alphaproteobacteria bacterium]|nr:hypothetical protein [Alphaproteobacteria bacterium]
MLYACEGRHHVAVLKPDNNSALSFEYLTQRLIARKVGFGVYKNGTPDLPKLIENVKSGIHNVLLIESSIQYNEVYTEENRNDLDNRLINGELKIITISEDQKKNGKLVKIQGHKYPALEAFSLLMPRISHELSSGFLDGSFRGTVSGLQDLSLLQNGKIDQEIFMLKPSLLEANKHDHADGSYDEVFGATVSLLWLRAKGLGLEHKLTKETINWLFDKLEIREVEQNTALPMVSQRRLNGLTSTIGWRSN